MKFLLQAIPGSSSQRPVVPDLCPAFPPSSGQCGPQPGEMGRCRQHSGCPPAPSPWMLASALGHFLQACAITVWRHWLCKLILFCWSQRNTGVRFNSHWHGDLRCVVTVTGLLPSLLHPICLGAKRGPERPTCALTPGVHPKRFWWVFCSLRPNPTNCRLGVACFLSDPGKVSFLIPCFLRNRDLLILSLDAFMRELPPIFRGGLAWPSCPAPFSDLCPGTCGGRTRSLGRVSKTLSSSTGLKLLVFLDLFFLSLAMSIFFYIFYSFGILIWIFSSDRVYDLYACGRHSKGKVIRGEMNWWGWDGLVGTPLTSDLIDWLPTNSLPDSTVFQFMKESDFHYTHTHTHTQIILLIN